MWYKGLRPSYGSHPTLVRAQAPTQTKETMMRFYTQQHQFYCGIDLHARLLAICIVDQAGAVMAQHLETQVVAEVYDAQHRCDRDGQNGQTAQPKRQKRCGFGHGMSNGIVHLGLLTPQDARGFTRA